MEPVVREEKFFVFGFLLVCFSCILFTYSTHWVISTDVRPRSSYQEIFKKTASSNSYTNHLPILINGDEDFENQSLFEGWVGNGSSNFPFIIENYSITGDALTDTSAIEIRNTNLSFIIRNNYLINGSNDIHLVNIKNSVIHNNTIIMDYSPMQGYGIDVRDSNNCQITKNIVYIHERGHQVSGIEISDSDNVLIKRNSIACETKTEIPSIVVLHSSNITIDSNINQAIYCHDVPSISVTNNTISESSSYGVYLGECLNALLSNNRIFNNQIEGIFISSQYATIANNYIAFNGIGAELSDQHILFSNNTVISNIYRGLEFIGHGKVYWNSFINNTVRSSSITSVSFENNYWDNWTTPDVNNDGIVDLPYFIETVQFGSNKDPSPLVLPINQSVYRPKLVMPNGGEILSGNTTIRWTTMSNLRFPTHNYSLFFSSDEGASWISLATDISDTMYQWDTTKFPDLTNSLIKVSVINPTGPRLESASGAFFTIINDPEIVEAMSQESDLGSLRTYNLTINFDGDYYTGFTSLSNQPSVSITTSFGTFSNIREISYSTCNVTDSRTRDYIEIRSWNSYYSPEVDHVIKSENTWFMQVTGYEYEVFTMMSEYGEFEVIADNESRYEETYIQRYYINGDLEEELLCRDILTFVRMEMLTLDIGTFECIVMNTDSYEQDIRGGDMVYIGYTLNWISLNGTILQQEHYNKYDELLLSLILSKPQAPSTLTTLSSSTSTTTPSVASGFSVTLLAVILLPAIKYQRKKGK